MSQSSTPSHSSSEKVELSIHIDSELLDQIKHLTNDPSKVIETAIKQWLRGERREDDQAMSLRRNPPVPPRGEWNDWGSVLSRPIQRVQICWVWNFARANSGCDLRQILGRNTGCSEQSGQTHNLGTFLLWRQKNASQSPTWVTRSLKFWWNFQTRSLISADY